MENLYYIDDDYINYLKKFDSKVAYNKNGTRPYIGIVYTYKNHNYFAPLASPKEKHLKINAKAIDIFKIDEGKLGVVNINNMIPTPMNVLTEVLPTVSDKKYKVLLENQLTFLNNHKAELFKKIEYFQRLYKKGHLSDNVLERTCDFILLEQKVEEYCK